MVKTGKTEEDEETLEVAVGVTSEGEVAQDFGAADQVYLKPDAAPCRRQENILVADHAPSLGASGIKRRIAKLTTAA